MKIADSVPTAAEDWNRWCSLTTDALARYQNELLGLRSKHPGLTAYTIVSRVSVTNGTFPWKWGAEGEIRETINSLNAWGERLHSWNAWNQVIKSYNDESENWEVLNHFAEPLAFFCMLQPSSLADRITIVAETLLHQANLQTLLDYPDHLEQDNLPQGGILRRSNRRKQLKNLGKSWKKYPAFHKKLAALDGNEYQKTTQNFRDLTSHAFAPRFMLGDVIRAIRSIVPFPKMIQRTGGTFECIEDPERFAVQYSMSAMQPLPLEAAFSANLNEYIKSRETIEAFIDLINELCDSIDAMPPPVKP